MSPTETWMRVFGGLLVLFICFAGMFVGMRGLWRLRRSKAFLLPAACCALTLACLFIGGFAFVLFREAYSLVEAKAYAVECVELLHAGGVPAMSPNVSPDERADIAALADAPPPVPVRVEVEDSCVVFYVLRMVPDTGPSYFVVVDRVFDGPLDLALPAEFQVEHIGWPLHGDAEGAAEASATQPD
ncbi:MAG: hypothetical protein GY851_12910 [bacterium]|nr:hypothetical protein [bacterium]